MTPLDKLLGREKQIFAERDQKLEQARQRRAQKRQRQQAADECYTDNAWPEDRALLGSTPSAEPGPEAKSGGMTPPSLLPTLLLAASDKSQGVWGTESPESENNAVSPHSTH